MLTGMFALFFGFHFLGILYFIFWLWVLIDCLKNTRLQGTEKLVWVLVIIFLQLLGPILYLVIAKDRTT